MESSKASSSSTDCTSDTESQYTCTEDEKCNYKPKINYIRTPVYVSPFVPQQQQQQFYQRKQPYILQSFDNYAFSPYPYVPSYVPSYYSQVNNINQQRQLEINNRAAAELLQLRYIVPSTQDYAIKHQKDPRSLYYRPYQNINDGNQTLIQRPISYVHSNIKTVMHPNEPNSTSSTLYNGNQLNYYYQPPNLASYDAAQQQHHQQQQQYHLQQLRRGASYGNDLKFLNLNAIGATANLNANPTKKEEFDGVIMPTGYQNSRRNFLNDNEGPCNRKNIIFISTLIAICAAVIIGVIVLGAVLKRDDQARRLRMSSEFSGLNLNWLSFNKKPSTTSTTIQTTPSVNVSKFNPFIATQLLNLEPINTSTKYPFEINNPVNISKKGSSLDEFTMDEPKPSNFLPDIQVMVFPNTPTVSIKNESVLFNSSNDHSNSPDEVRVTIKNEENFATSSTMQTQPINVIKNENISSTFVINTTITSTVTTTTLKANSSDVVTSTSTNYSTTTTKV